ncbi:MAG: hypothetical protein DSY42_04815 [Aquifex sp.]|nr:MAG: hypothetical protein DSY42_04815 [Aquifex sp.]
MRKVKYPSAYRIALGSEKGLKSPKGKIVIGEKALEKPSLVEWLSNVEELVEMYPTFVEDFEERFGTKVKAITTPLELYDQLSEVKAGKKLLKYAKEKEIEVFPQGYVVLKAYVKRGVFKPEEKVLVIDGGFKTLNTAIANEERVLWKRSFYDELGIKVMLVDIFREELKKKYPEITANPQVLKEAFISGKISTSMKEVSVQKEKEKAIKTFIKVMFERLKRELDQSGQGFESLLILGGISHYLSPEMFKTDKKIVIAEEKEFANAVCSYELSQGTSLDLGFGDVKGVIP